MELLDCNIHFFIEWMKYQFEGMTLDNYGKIWHVDHVFPCAHFDLSDENEQLICFNWSNLRPCYAQENLSKSDKIIPPLIESQAKKAEQFLALNKS